MKNTATHRFTTLQPRLCLSRHIPIALIALCPMALHAQWEIKTYGPGTATSFQTTSLSTADQVISGSNREYFNTATYTTSNTQDNGNAGGPFGLGVQLVGLPSGDNDDFVFQALGNFNVTAGGSYVFANNTDDGSRLRLSIDGGAFTDVILDSALSGPHTVSGSAVSLNAGSSIQHDGLCHSVPTDSLGRVSASKERGIHPPGCGEHPGGSLHVGNMHRWQRQARKWLCEPSQQYPE